MSKLHDIAPAGGHPKKAKAPKAEKTRMTVKERMDGLNAAYERYQLTKAPALSLKEQMFFFKRLAFLIRAGVPILESLSMMSDQAATRGTQRVLESVRDDIANGSSLARSLSKFPRIFGDFGVNIIKIGESSGTLADNLEYLADELGKRHALGQKITSAFIYPAVITAATVGITAFLMLYLFPKILPVFASLHMDLPLSTRIVISLSNFLSAWGLHLVVALILLSILLSMLIAKSERVRLGYHGLLLRLPIIGPIFRSYNLSNGCRTLGVLLNSGITLAEAVPLTSDTTRNLVYRAEYRKVTESVLRGERLSLHLSTNTMLFPSILPQMLAVGERSGNLSTTLVYLSELYEGEVEDFTKNLSSLIEPALMVTMGIVVGFIAVSIITPIYGITQNLHG